MAPSPLTDAVDTPFRMTDRTRLVDDVTRHLREMILSGDLPPGTPLLQIELSKQLGVSRTPLREAFRILESDGLVRISNGNRTVEVADYTSTELRELYELREFIDALAARLAAKKRLTSNEEMRLTDALLEIESAGRSRPLDHARHLRAHVEFHVAIAEASGNSKVVGLTPLIRMTGAALFPSFLDEERRDEFLGYLEEGISQHRAIYEAIVDGDARRAEQLARRHIAATLRSGLIEAATRNADDDVTSEVGGPA